MQDYKEIANQLADISRATVLKYFRTNLDILDKQDASPVTVSDRAVEAELRDTLARLAPTHGIIGEEFPNVNENADYTWVIDPIDGTRSFIMGVPLFTTLIALLHKGKPIFGVIDQPFTAERWYGGTDIPSAYTHQDKAPQAITTSNVTHMGDALFACTDMDMFNDAELVQFQKLKSVCKHVRHGTDAYGFAMTAMGHMHGVIESDLKLYDYAAPTAVIIGAGGACTDWQGNAISTQTGNQILATANEKLHEQALKIISHK